MSSGGACGAKALLLQTALCSPTGASLLAATRRRSSLGLQVPLPLSSLAHAAAHSLLLSPRLFAKPSHKNRGALAAQPARELSVWETSRGVLHAAKDA